MSAISKQNRMDVQRLKGNEIVPPALLYHGTRTLDQILEAGVINLPPHGDIHVSLTHEMRVALYWAQLERDGENETPGILVFDRRALLASGHELFAYDGTGLDDEGEIASANPIHLHEGLVSALRLV